MFKKILSLALASTMALGMAANSFAAAANPIAAIEGNGYAYDSDLAGVDLRNPNPAFGYGDTAYYPLLNAKGAGTSADVDAAQNALIVAQSGKEAADNALKAANETAKIKASALTDAAALKVKAEAVLAAATAWKQAADTGSLDVATKQAEYNTAFAAYDKLGTAAADATVALNNATSEDAKVAQIVLDATNDKSTADAAVVTADGNVKSAIADVKAKQDALNVVLKANFKYVYESDAVKNVKLKNDWSMNGKLVKSTEIVKKKAIAATELEQKYIYFLAVAIDESTSTKETDITGTVSMRKSGEFDYEERRLEVAIAVSFPTAHDSIITDKVQIFSDGNGFSSDAEDELRFDVDEDSFFTVNTVGQGKLLLAANSRFNNEIAEKYPTANLDFLNGNGASFNKIGVMTISAEKDSFIY
ncbi:MAG: hypothetical protein RR315_03650, partial [Oscillospiraceae bacterium]